jgi:hypothetical protein
VIENSSKRDVAMFVLALAVAGCLMICTINLSIDRLLYTDWDQETVALSKLQVRSLQPDRPACMTSRQITPEATLHLSATALEPCHAAELELAPSF